MSPFLTLGDQADPAQTVLVNPEQVLYVKGGTKKNTAEIVLVGNLVLHVEHSVGAIRGLLAQALREVNRPIPRTGW